MEIKINYICANLVNHFKSTFKNEGLKQKTIVKADHNKILKFIAFSL